jgi:sugar phosphate isomerase/epimerase
MFGVSTFCLHNLPLPKALDRITEVTNYIEIMDDGPHHVESAELLRNYSARYSFHAPSRGVNIASLLEPIRRASVEVIGHCFAVAAEVNAPVIIHPGYFAWPVERSRAEQQLRISLAELNRLKSEYGIDFFVENMGNWDYFLLKKPDDLCLIDGSGFALDVGHANQNNCLSEFLVHPAGHYHLHDNKGIEDTHSEIGTGTINFSEVMCAVRKSRVIPIIEVATFDAVRNSILRLESG